MSKISIFLIYLNILRKLLQAPWLYFPREMNWFFPFIFQERRFFDISTSHSESYEFSTSYSGPIFSISLRVSCMTVMNGFLSGLSITITSSCQTEGEQNYSNLRSDRRCCWYVQRKFLLIVVESIFPLFSVECISFSCIWYQCTIDSIIQNMIL